MKRKRFLAVACAAAMIASMTTGLAVNVSAADEKSDFAGEELSILVSAGWMDNRYDETIKRFEDTYDVTVDLRNTVSTLQELPGRTLCLRQEKSPAYTTTSCTDFRSGTLLRSM